MATKASAPANAVGTYAVVEKGRVTNLIVWDGNTDTWPPPEGATMVPVPDGVTVEPGFTYKAGKFSGVLQSDADAAALHGKG